jgi:hypothetical protein
VRIDGYSKKMNFFGGLANGQASPVVINLQTNTQTPGQILHEYFVGAGRAFQRADTTVVLDFVRLGGSDHVTLTFSCILHKRQGGSG